MRILLLKANYNESPCISYLFYKLPEGLTKESWFIKMKISFNKKGNDGAFSL
ncbi:hypothetical protein ANT_20940 [Anaerolinea thermophila UNI-1]|uniref:Uncharacterized protein n=1 Tax=Anaerolinea thermophila (strain DSM 14523 / JCM 11388 / NBRC 100420 / UNI-1) TaxID=926569 RepID=E8MXN9_ANATU|nr:hypothetical protein ANT_20940 [Anaerolinea thermophila UNI-1]